VVWDLGEVEAWLEERRRKPIEQAEPPDVTRRRSRPVGGAQRRRFPSSQAALRV
jgi:prophage regulatory protein